MEPIDETKASADMDIQNLQMGGDEFDRELGTGEAKSKVHIRTQQRNGRKSITTVQGLDRDLDLKKICKAFKKSFSCNGAVVKSKDEEMGKVIQLQGDQRQNVFSFMKRFKVCEEERMVVHGF